jgi:cytochrome c biogenesis protein ResB
MKNFFLSLKTSVWTLFVLVCIFFLGSYMMPMHREVFAGMNEDILFGWVESTALGNLWYTWWFFAALAGLVLLTINTLVCSIQAVRGRWTRGDFLLRISPQVVHAGFLLILLAHLLGAGWGYRASGMMPEGAYAQLPENRVLHLRAVHVQTDERGFMRDYAVEAQVFENNQQVAAGTLGPNKPLFYQGMGIYLKHLSFEGRPTALLVVSRDPGALWAFAGGVLFMIGALALLVLKWKRAQLQAG